MRTWLLVIVFAFFVAPSAYMGAQGASPTISITLDGPDSPTKLGSAVPMHVALENLSDREIVFPDNKEGEAAWAFTIKAADENGHEPAKTDYFQAILHGGSFELPNGRTAVVPFSIWPHHIRPGDVLKYRFDLNHLYKIHPGRYTVTVETPDPVLSTDNAPVIVKSNSVTVAVAP